MNIRGIVKVEAQVAPNGTVKTVVVKGGHPILVQSAVTAVGHWKFEPSPHDTKELIEIKFDLPGAAARHIRAVACHRGDADTRNASGRMGVSCPQESLPTAVLTLVA